MAACRQALRARPCGRPGGDGGAVASAVWQQVGPEARVVSAGGCEQALERDVARGVVSWNVGSNGFYPSSSRHWIRR